MRIKLKQSLLTPIPVLIIFILLAASNKMNVNSLAHKDNIFLALIIMQIVIFIIPGILYCKIRKKALVASLRFNPMVGPSKIWLSFTAFFVLISGSALIKLGLYALGYKGTEYSLYQSYIPTTISGFGNVLYIIIAIALMPAITEELVFRGIVLGEYTSSACNTFTAVGITSLLFAMMHMSLPQFPVFLFGGILLAYVTIVTDSVLCAITLHFLNNCFSLLFETKLLSLVAKTDSIIFIVFLTAVVFLVFLVFTLLYMPCVAAVAAIRRELGSTGYAALAMAFQTAVAWLVAFGVYLIGGLIV